MQRLVCIQSYVPWQFSKGLHEYVERIKPTNWYSQRESVLSQNHLMGIEIMCSIELALHLDW